MSCCLFGLESLAYLSDTQGSADGKRSTCLLENEAICSPVLLYWFSLYLPLVGCMRKAFLLFGASLSRNLNWLHVPGTTGGLSIL